MTMAEFEQPFFPNPPENSHDSDYVNYRDGKANRVCRYAVTENARRQRQTQVKIPMGLGVDK